MNTTIDTINDDIPLEEYQRRAGATHRPGNWLTEAERWAHDIVTARQLAISTTTPLNFYADISEFQNYLDGSYPYPIINCRIDNGYRIDNHFTINHQRVQSSAHIEVEKLYVVLKPGQVNNTMARIRSVLGAKCPGKVVFEIDMESGSDFAGPGDHSGDGNALAYALAQYTGNQQRVMTYANRYDYMQNWPNMAPWLVARKTIASYGTQNPGGYAWQYYGGLNYPTLAGYPRSCPPFGGWVDMNVISRDLATIKRDYGLYTPPVGPIVSSGILASGAQLRAGQLLKSPHGIYALAMQTDGNFVVYHGSRPIWAINKFGSGRVAVMQTDGNLVVYAPGTKPVWDSNTAGQAGAQLHMQDDGNLVIYRSGRPIWATNTMGR